MTRGTPATEHPLEALRALERVFQGIAHDVSNPLAAVIGYAQLAQVETDAARRARYLDAVVSQAGAIRDLVGDLQAASSTLPTPGERFLLGDAASLAVMSGAARLVLDAADPIEVVGDRDAVVLALKKLVANAALAGGDVVVRVHRREGVPCVTVEDGGPGFTDEARRRAFEPGFTTRRTGNGLGLGLPVAVAVAERHGGAVIVDDARGGARVHLVLGSSAPAA